MKVWEYLARLNFNSKDPGVSMDQLIQDQPEQVLSFVTRWLKGNLCTPTELLLLLPAKQRSHIKATTIGEILMSDLCFFDPKVIKGAAKTPVQGELNEVAKFEPRVIPGGNKMIQK